MSPRWERIFISTPISVEAADPAMSPKLNQMKKARPTMFWSGTKPTRLSLLASRLSPDSCSGDNHAMCQITSHLVDFGDVSGSAFI